MMFRPDIWVGRKERLQGREKKEGKGRQMKGCVDSEKWIVEKTRKERTRKRDNTCLCL